MAGILSEAQALRSEASESEFTTPMHVRSTVSELEYRSSAIPGGTMAAALYDRTFMQLSDRGAASNLIGDRWASLCADALEGSSPETTRVRTGPDETLASSVVRLDHIPAIARIASRHKLQNPDFLLIGSNCATEIMWAADAKFSIETARIRQVSEEVVSSLLDLSDIVRRLLPPLETGVRVRNGVFVCPDYPLTHHLLAVRSGPRRAMVDIRHVRFLKVCPADMFDSLGLLPLQRFMAALDTSPFDRDDSLLTALYYFRLSRAAVGCWLDQTSPLLAHHDTQPIDETAIESDAKRIAQQSHGSAWGMIRRWNDEADIVRRQRSAIEEVIQLPVRNRALRAQIEENAAAAGAPPPSLAKIRRVLGSWYRSRIRDEFGPITPPVVDIGELLGAIGKFCHSLEPEFATMTSRVIEEIVTAPPIAELDGEC